MALWFQRIKIHSSIRSQAVSRPHCAALGSREWKKKPELSPWTWPGTAEEVWEQARAVATPSLPMFERVRPEKWDEINSEVHRSISRYVVGDEIKFGAVVALASGSRP